MHETTLMALPHDTPLSTIPILDEIARERIAQVARGYDQAHDDALGRTDWTLLAADRFYRADEAAHFEKEAPIYRRELVVAAALAVAALEAHDRALAAQPTLAPVQP